MSLRQNKRDWLAKLFVSVLPACICWSAATFGATKVQFAYANDKQTDQAAVAVRSIHDLLAGQRPAAARVLFDGTRDHLMLSNTGKPINWKIDAGSLVSTPKNKRSNHIVSKLHFRDALIHVEFMLPSETSGNSGIYIHGLYELQILNSAKKKTLSTSDAGAIYNIASPLVNACLGPGHWQVYNIEFRSPVRDDQGEIIKKGSITSELNGQIVQDSTPIGEPRSRFNPYRYRSTPYLKAIAEQLPKTMIGPLFLQDHDSPVRFRNVWVLPLDDHASLYESN